MATRMVRKAPTKPPEGSGVAKATTPRLKRPRPAEAPPEANGAQPSTKRTESRFAGGMDDPTRPQGGMQGGVWRIKGSMSVRFLSEYQPTEHCESHQAMVWFQQAYIPDENRSVLLERGADPPPGSRVQTRYLAGVLDYTEDDAGRFKYLELPSSLEEAIRKRFERFGTICDRVAYLDKEGTGLKTSYSIDWGDKDPLPRTELAKHRAQIDVFEALDKEDERLKAQPPRKKIYRRSELLDMDRESLKEVATRLNVPVKGRKPREVIDDILDMQES